MTTSLSNPLDVADRHRTAPGPSSAAVRDRWDATPGPGGRAGDDAFRARRGVADRSHVLYLFGDLDPCSRDALARAGLELLEACIADRSRRAVTDAIDIAISRCAVVDLSGLDFVDAAGLGVLVSLHVNLHRAGIPSRTVHAASQVRRVVALCGLDDALGTDVTRPTGAVA